MSKTIDKEIDTVSSLKTREEKSNDKKWTRFFKPSYWNSLFEKRLNKMIKNDNKELGLFFAKRKFLSIFWTSMAIFFLCFLIFILIFVLVSNNLFMQQFTLIAIFGIIILPFLTFFSYITLSDKYSYKLQLFNKKIFVRFVNETQKNFYLNDVRVPTLAFRYKTLEKLQLDFSANNVYEKRMFLVKVLIDLQNKIKQKDYISLPDIHDVPVKGDIYNALKVRKFFDWIKKPFSKSPIYNSKTEQEYLDIELSQIIENIVEEEIKIEQKENKQKQKPSRKKQRGGPKKENKNG